VAAQAFQLNLHIRVELIVFGDQCKVLEQLSQDEARLLASEYVIEQLLQVWLTEAQGGG
jgi:hypothetical protein